MNHIEFRLAKHQDFSETVQLYTRCKKALQKSGIMQWGEWEGGYPHSGFLKEALDKEELFLLEKDKKICGAVVLNSVQADVWKPIPWDPRLKNPLVIHALIIDPDTQGQGLGKRLLEECESYAVKKGYDSMRLDAFSGNEISNRLYVKYSYRKCGSVFFPGKPQGHQEYFCYDKEL